MLEYWKGERVLYTEDGAKHAEVAGILTPDLEENRKVGTAAFVQLPPPDTAWCSVFAVVMQRTRNKDSANGQRKPAKARKQVSMAKSVDAAASGDDVAEKVVAPGVWLCACLCCRWTHAHAFFNRYKSLLLMSDLVMFQLRCLHLFRLLVWSSRSLRRSCTAPVRRAALCVLVRATLLCPSCGLCH